MATRQQSYWNADNHYADALRYALGPLICKIPDLELRTMTKKWWQFWKTGQKTML